MVCFSLYRYAFDASMEALLHITVGSCALACRQLPHLELVCSADASNLPVHLMLVMTDQPI